MYRLDDYPYILKWGTLLGSHGGYIHSQILQARKDKAPANAIYRKGDGSWATTDGIIAEDTRKDLGLPPLPAKRRAELALAEAKRLRAEADRLEEKATALMESA